MDEATKAKFKEILAESIGEQIDIKTKGLQDEIEKLATKLAEVSEPLPKENTKIHVLDGVVQKGFVHDDGVIQQVGESLFKLPEGAVVNPS